jgi:hypothetical protein
MDMPCLRIEDGDWWVAIGAEQTADIAWLRKAAPAWLQRFRQNPCIISRKQVLRVVRAPNNRRNRMNAEQTDREQVVRDGYEQLRREYPVLAVELAPFDTHPDLDEAIEELRCAWGNLRLLAAEVEEQVEILLGDRKRPVAHPLPAGVVA